MIDVTQIKEGMTVYTEANEKIGTVDDVQFGDEDPNHPGAETASTQIDNGANTLVESLARALVDEGDHIPVELRKRLQRYGYIRLKTGNLFESDYYIPMYMVTSVAGANVHVKATKDNLVKA